MALVRRRQDARHSACSRSSPRASRSRSSRVTIRVSAIPLVAAFCQWGGVRNTPLGPTTIKPLSKNWVATGALPTPTCPLVVVCPTLRHKVWYIKAQGNILSISTLGSTVVNKWAAFQCQSFKFKYVSEIFLQPKRPCKGGTLRGLKV